MPVSQTQLKMRGISIEFPGVKALDNVDFEMASGTIRALIGANGAGKSTLMKVLSGVYTHYQGEILINDQLSIIDTTRKAKELGIDIVYQEVDTALIPYLSVAENIMLDHMVNDMNGTRMKWKRIHEKADQTLRRLGVNLDVKRKVSDLQLAEKQMVLIARAIVHERKFLILDEPTAPLSSNETKELFRIVRHLSKDQGIGIIFISHRLPELFEVCEEISIMKDGKMIHESIMENITPSEVIDIMLGKKFTQERRLRSLPSSEIELIRINQLYEREDRIKDISMTVRSGEIVGIAGLVGAGKTELLKTIFGVYETSAGELLVQGRKSKHRSPYDAIRNGIGLVPEERRKEGVLVEEPVYKNLTATNLSAYTSLFGKLNPQKEKQVARSMIKQLGIKTPDENQQVALLSGGNQQKVAIGKWMLSDVNVLLFDEPTKGVDVGAKGDIFDLIHKLADEEKGIIYATSEINEILHITDRVYVMYDGRIVSELQTNDTTEEEIMYFATGGTRQ